MPAAIGSPALCIFVENGLRAIYEATTKNVFEDAFDQFFSRELDVTVNGETATRQYYKQLLWDEKYHERSVSASFLGLLAVPSDNEHVVRQTLCLLLNPAPDHPLTHVPFFRFPKTGTVGVFLTAVINFLPPGGRPTRERVTASYRLIIESQGTSVEPIYDGDSGRPREIEIRRVTSVDVVVNAKAGSEDLLSAL
ncbi:hypothetical protein EIP86_006915 [Pleurotus ostreatoroseus]|nr:hypothetical protein EIP86_006915 [Pleurotus ostreatoroseus]